MPADPAIGSGRFPGRVSQAHDPRGFDREREVRDMARLLIDSAENLEVASELVTNSLTASSLAEMSHMRRRAADTVIGLAADAGVAVREDPPGALGGAIDRGITTLAAGDDVAVIEHVLTRDDRLVVRLDAALGADLPPAVKDQLRLVGAQVRDGLRSMAGWA